jgi:hypothetical protein
MSSTRHGQPCIAALCAAGALVMVRTVFRLNESAQGVFGYLFTHEIPFGTLEFAPIVVAVGLLAIFTPTLLAKIDHAMVKSYGTEEGEPVRIKNGVCS